MTTEAEASFFYLRDIKGINEDDLIVEKESTTTRENSQFAAKIIKDQISKSFQEIKVLVVTDTYHAWRCHQIFSRNFPNVQVIGAISSLYHRSYFSLREVLAVAKHFFLDAIDLIISAN